MEGTEIAIILGALLAISEAMALIPSFKNSGILQLVISVLKKLLKKDRPPEA